MESRPGDVFLLGTHSWRIRRVEPGTVRVVDAHGAPPSVPHWQGEAPGRTRELSEEVSALRQAVADRSPSDALSWLQSECGIDRPAAEIIVAYLRAGLAALGALPTMNAIILERFFDEAGGMQLVGHAPFGARVNRAFGLALRKRFCVTFDFELQAAASDDAILLSLGPQHSFPLDRVPRFLASATVEEVVRQAVLTSPLFQARWRWNLNTSLTVLRMRGGRKNPPAIQRMEADDLMAAVFPTLAACQENVAPGPLDIPDHPLVRQTLEDCLHEAMDIDGLRELVAGIEAGRIAVITRDTTEPSVLAHEILNGPPFTYLDDETEAGNRRSRAVPLPRGLPVDARDLARLDPAAIARVRDEVRPVPRDADELHDLLMTLYVTRPVPSFSGWFEALAAAGRAGSMTVSDGELWCATERTGLLASLFGGAGPAEPEAVAAEMLRGHLEVSGPVTASDLAFVTGLGESDVSLALVRLETEGFALRGRFTDPDTAAEEWCARRVLTRIHAYSRQRKRREVEPVTAQDFMRFLLRWQHVTPDTRREGSRGVLAVAEQLQGFELAAGAWEKAILPARVTGYRKPRDSRFQDETAPFPGGVERQAGTRHFPTVIDSAYNSLQFWDGRQPGTGRRPWPIPWKWPTPRWRSEAPASRSEVPRTLQEGLGHRIGLAVDIIPMKSLASFERTVIAGDSPFDRSSMATTGRRSLPAAQRGLIIFISTQKQLRCTTPSNTLHGQQVPHNLGIGADTRGNLDRRDQEQCRHGSLQNALASDVRPGPYMHDGLSHGRRKPPLHQQQQLEFLISTRNPSARCPHLRRARRSLPAIPRLPQRQAARLTSARLPTSRLPPSLRPAKSFWSASARLP